MSYSYKVLNQKHLSYDPERLEKYESLYCGGDEIIENAHLFLPKMPVEKDPAYKERLKNASYINYFAEIIDYFAANLFSKELTVSPAADASDPSTPGKPLPDEKFYRAFSVNADNQNNALSVVLKAVFIDCLTYGSGCLGVDFPKKDVEPNTLAEEEQLGVDRAYTYSIDPESLINWDKDEFGRFKWCILKKVFIPQDGPFLLRNQQLYQFKVWFIDNGVAKWELYQFTKKIGYEPQDKDMAVLIDSGETSFNRIPILCMEMEKGLCIGNKIGNLVADHFRLRTGLLHAENRSLYALPYLKLGPEIDENGNPFSLNGNDHTAKNLANAYEARGFGVIGPKDELGFMEPTGAAYVLANDQLKELADEIHRIVHQMANSIVSQSKAIGRSGDSKEQDHRATEILLSEYGSLVKEFARELYDCVSSARQEDVVWSALGLDNYQVVNKDQLLAEALAFNTQVNIPSPTFNKLHLTALATSFIPNVSPETQLTIKNEIEEFIDANGHSLVEVKREQDQEMMQQQMDAKATAKPPFNKKKKA